MNFRRNKILRMNDATFSNFCIYTKITKSSDVLSSKFYFYFYKKWESFDLTLNKPKLARTNFANFSFYFFKRYQSITREGYEGYSHDF